MGAACARKQVYEPAEPGQIPIFDAHCHYFDYQQETDGLDKLLLSMGKAGVVGAAIMGNPFKKARITAKVPKHPTYDDGELYYFTATDYRLAADLKALPANQRHKLAFCVCGINLGDKDAASMLQNLIQTYPDVRGVGRLPLRAGLETNLILRGAADLDYAQTTKEVIAMCKQRERPIPYIVTCNACCRRVWKDRRAFQYLEELGDVAAANPSVPLIWTSGGIFNGGYWAGYDAAIVKLLEEHSNIYMSITPDVLHWDQPGIGFDLLLSVTAHFPERVVLGTTVMGAFQSAPKSAAWHELSYEEEVEMLKSFIRRLAQMAGIDVAIAVSQSNAERIFGMGATPVEKRLLSIPHKAAPINHGDADPHADHHYGSTGNMPGKVKTPAQQAPTKPPPSERKWTSVDCHFHLFDFSQKSCGTAAALRALDEAHVEKAVLLGLGCCKKWVVAQKERPLWYTDDNGPCYFYAFADQMLADAWLALANEGRRRLAPMLAGFDPTDKNSICHVRRMYDKYPRLWRGLGEVLCRHDDLTSTLMNKEVPRPNHPGMDPIYEFCIERNLPIVVHSNADRVGDDDGEMEYQSEVEDVLTRYPTLKFVWCHAGVSRMTGEANQHEHCDRMLSKYPNLSVDISWVVWEQVIAPDGNIKDVWVKLIEKHSARVTIGSDNTGQFWTPDMKKNTLIGQITKYWPLFELLTPEAAKRVSYENGYNMFFKDWDMPLVNDSDHRYQQSPQCYPCEFLDKEQREFFPGEKVSKDAADFKF